MNASIPVTDWESFETLFRPRKATLKPEETDNLHSKIFVVVQDDLILYAYSNGDDFSDWMGISLEAFREQMSHREMIVVKKEVFDRALMGGLALPHLLDQQESLKTQMDVKVFPAGKRSESEKKLKDVSASLHFVLQALQTWWAKVLPSAYGIYIRLELKPSELSALKLKELMVVVRAGRIESFQEPDLSHLGQAHHSDPERCVKALSERHLVPTQGLVISAQLWEELSNRSLCKDPWKKMAQLIRSNQAQLVPFRWGVASLIGARGVMGI